MEFKGTPRDLAYTAAKWLVLFIGATIILYLVDLTWFVFTSREDASTFGEAVLIWLAGALFYVGASVVLEALATSMLGWLIALPGIFLANGAQRFASFIFAFAAFAAGTGFSSQFWFAAVPSFLALGYLALWAWSLRNHVEIVHLEPGQVEGVAQQQQALRAREIQQEDVISQR